MAIDTKRTPMKGHKLLDTEGNEIGALTSGTNSFALSKGIGMGYVSTAFLKTKAKDIQLDIRGKTFPGQIVKAPFVETHYYRSS